MFRSSQKQPGAARSSQGQPEAARSSQEQPEQPGAAGSSQKQPGAGTGKFYLIVRQAIKNKTAKQTDGQILIVVRHYRLDRRCLNVFHRRKNI